AMMGPPFELGAPVSRRDDDRQLVQLLWHSRGEARGCSELLPQIAHLGTPELHVERTLDTAARASQHMLDHRSLGGRHLVVGEWLEAISAKTDASGVRPRDSGRLTGGDTHDGERRDTENEQAGHDISLRRN